VAVLEILLSLYCLILATC